MSDQSFTIKVPTDVWTMIVNKSSIDYVYVATVRSTTNTYWSEIGVFKEKRKSIK